MDHLSELFDEDDEVDEGESDKDDDKLFFISLSIFE
jgi:hypothetical protein